MQHMLHNINRRSKIQSWLTIAHYLKIPQVIWRIAAKCPTLCGIHGIQVYASSEFTTASRFTLFESAKAIVQLVNVMKMESSGFGLAHMRITTNFYLNGVRWQISTTLPLN